MQSIPEHHSSRYETAQVGKGTYGRITKRNGRHKNVEYYILVDGTWEHRTPLPKAHKDAAKQAFTA